MRTKTKKTYGYVILGIITWCVIPLVLLFVVVKVFANAVAEDSYYPLGQHYYYVIDPENYLVCYREYHYNWLVFYEIDDYEEILSGYIKKYGSDKNYLILLTKDLQTKDTVYWFVTKKTREALSFRDSSSFAQALFESGCSLTLTKTTSAAINYRYE